MSSKSLKIYGVLLVIIIFLVNAVPINAQTDGPYDLYLPVVMKNYPTYPVFGVEISQFSPDVLQKADDANNYWVRHNGLLWSTLQPNQGQAIDWSAVSTLESYLIDASTRGMEVILIVRSTPTWAQRYPGVYCGPVAQENFTDFANFMSVVVQRYSQPPFNVKYYEIGNEPDVDYSLVNPTSPYGCWGNKDIEFYDGGYYAEMLKVVYPAIKSANSQAQIVLGGLLLDCDPRNYGENSPYCQTEVDTLAGMFLEGILRNGGGNYLDVISFHGYPQYQTGMNPIFRELNYRNWRAAGGVVAGKIEFLRSVISAYGVNKPIFNTESGLRLPDLANSTPEFEQAKADYLMWLYARNWSQGIKATNWFTFNGPGFFYSGLLDSSQNPLPAYYAFQFMANTLNKAEYVRTFTSETDPDMIGFEFSTSTKIYWLLFSREISLTTPNSYTLPAGVNTVYDSQGAIVNQVDSTIDINHPKYVEFLK